MLVSTSARHGTSLSRVRSYACLLRCRPRARRVAAATSAAAAAAGAAAGHTVAADAPAAQPGGGMAGRVRLAVVGDVHGHSTQSLAPDAAALHALAPDAVLWVGDIGNECVALVQQIASMSMQKMVVLGNHDSWYSLTAASRARRDKSRSRSGSPQTEAGEGQQQQQQPQASPPTSSTASPAEDGVQQQLDALGGDHVGYGAKALAGTNVTVVGARPFTKGGDSWSSIADFMARFGVTSMASSAEKILGVIQQQVPAGNVVLLAHNGPLGLGDQPHSICGVDWLPGAGDHGDPDLAAALQQLAAAGRSVPLVVHGHMHHTLRGGGLRTMAHVDATRRTVFLNAATVPRMVPLPPADEAAAAAGGHAARHHFLLVDLDLVDGRPHCAADVWVEVVEQPACSPGQQQQQQDFCAATVSATHSLTARGKARKAAAQQQLLGERLQQQAPQQMHVDRQQQVVDGYAVRVAEAYEVLRTLEPDGDADSRPGWQWYDAHHGRWRRASGVAADQAAAATV